MFLLDSLDVGAFLWPIAMDHFMISGDSSKSVIIKCPQKVDKQRQGPGTSGERKSGTRFLHLTISITKR
jgi:hypothetical protein